MEMAEYRDDGIWEVVPTDPVLWGADRPLARTRRRHWNLLLRTHRGRATALPAPRPRLVGWSLLGVVGANIALIAIIVVIGLSPIGLTACAALALSSWLLVLAELLSLRRLYGLSR